YLAPPGRVGGQQYAAFERAQEGVEWRERLHRAHIDAQLAWRGGGEIAHQCRFTAQLGVRLECIERDAGESCEVRFELLGLEEEPGGREQRPLEIVPPFLVALADLLPVLEQRAGE